MGLLEATGNKEAAGDIMADVIKARVANELTVDDNLAIVGNLSVDTIRSNVASPSKLTLDDNVQNNQDLACFGTLKLGGTVSSAGKVVIAGVPQNIPNEETALSLVGNNSSIKVEMENLGGGKTTK